MNQDQINVGLFDEVKKLQQENARLKEQEELCETMDETEKLALLRALQEIRDEVGLFGDVVSPRQIVEAVKSRLSNKDTSPTSTLPKPPPGMQWHRLDEWKGADLPQGYRPLCLDEIVQTNDHIRSLYRTEWEKTAITVGSRPNDWPLAEQLWRTTRPLVFTHEGKEWTWHRAGDPMPQTGTRLIETLFDDGSGNIQPASYWSWNAGECNPIGWRYADKPEPREVDLGPEDVPPMSIFKRESWDGNKNWLTVSQLTEGFVVLLGNEEHVTFEELRKEGYLINRPRHRDADGNPTLWEPCSKKVEC